MKGSAMELVPQREFDMLASGSNEVLLQPPVSLEKHDQEQHHVSSSTACGMTTDEDDDGLDEYDARLLGAARTRPRSTTKRITGAKSKMDTVPRGITDGTIPSVTKSVNTTSGPELRDTHPIQSAHYKILGCASEQEMTPPTDTDETEILDHEQEHEHEGYTTVKNESEALHPVVHEIVDSGLFGEESDSEHAVIAAETDYAQGIHSSPAPLDSGRPSRSSAELTLIVPSVVSCDERDNAAERLEEEEDDDDGSKQILDDGKLAAELSQEDQTIKFPDHANFEVHPKRSGEEKAAEQMNGGSMSAIPPYEHAVKEKERLHNEGVRKALVSRKDSDGVDKPSDTGPADSTGISANRPSFEVLPRTDFRWSVSVDGAIPGPPTSLQAGRNFSAPGAFRMYQTGILPEEADGSERFAAPRDLVRLDGDSAPFSPPEIDIAPPMLRAATSSDSYVVEAQLVRDLPPSDRRRRRQDMEMAVVEAKPLEEVGVFRIRRRVLCVTMVAIVAVALGVGVWLGQRNKAVFPENATVATPAPLPPLRDQFEAALTNYTLEALKRKNSTQSRAYSWVLSKEGMANVTTVERLLTRFALASLFYATGGGETWKENKGWLTAANECSWYVNDFFTPCPDGKSLVQVALYGNGLAGSIPAELGLLRQMKTLFLGSNDLIGTLPPQLAQASLLETVSLFDNHLRDLPGALAVANKLRYLKEFDIEFNRFKGSVPEPEMFENLTALNSLYIGGNRIRGKLPSGYADLPSLTSFSAVKSRLTGSIPLSFAKMTSMKGLYLSTNRLTGTISDALFDAWKYKMADLDLSQNKFIGTISTKIGRLSVLTTLSVFGNRFSGPLPTQLGLLTQLTDFALYANLFTGTIPTELGLLTNLRNLYLDGNALTGTIPTELGHLTDLTSIYLNGNQLSGSIPEGLCKLKKQNRYSGFDLNVNCDLVVCDCDCTCVGDAQRRR